MKEEVRANLAAAGHEVVDLGAYQVRARGRLSRLCREGGRGDQGGRGAAGILICGSGVGVCVAANKIPGIRAGICHDTYSAHQGVEHDDMNVLVLGARIIGSALAFELARHIRRREVSGQEGRFERRFKKVLAIEAKYRRGERCGVAGSTIANEDGNRQVQFDHCSPLRSCERTSAQDLTQWTHVRSLGSTPMSHRKNARTRAERTRRERVADAPLRRDPVRRRRSAVDQWLGPRRARGRGGAIRAGCGGVRGQAPEVLAVWERSAIDRQGHTWTRLFSMSRASFSRDDFFDFMLAQSQLLPDGALKFWRSFPRRTSICWAR